MRDLLQENDETAETKMIELTELKALNEQYETEILELRAQLESVLSGAQEEQAEEAQTDLNGSFKVASNKAAPRLYCNSIS